MSTRFIVSAVVGVAVGYFSGSPQAGFQAFALAYGVTAGLDPAQKVSGPRLDDLKIASGAYGVPIAYIEGHPRTAGNIVWCTDKREVPHEASQGGKGGPGVDTTTFTYEVDIMIAIAENPGVGVRRIWSNGALIWSAADDADDETLQASAAANSWRDIRFYDGNPDQMPDPTYESAVGVGNAPAMRDRSTVVIEGLNLGGSGQFPVLTFEVYSQGTKDEGTGFLEDFTDGLAPYDGAPRDVFSIVGGYFGQGLKITGGAATAVSESIAREVVVDSFTHATLKFRIDETSSEDGALNAPYCSVNAADDGSSRAFAFSPIREKSFDPGQRAAIYFDVGDSPHYVSGPDLLIPGQWYEVDIEILTPTLCRVILSFAGGATVKTTDIPGSYSSWTSHRLVFYDQAVLTSGFKPSVTYDEIVLGAPSTRVTLEEVPLDEVVQRQWLRAGLSLDYLDVTELEGKFVRAMAVSQVTAPRQVIETLASCYLFEAVESGAIVRMVARGGSVAATIPFEDLGATDSEQAVEAFPRVRGNELEVAAQVSVKFANVDDDYQDGNESSTRLATGSSIIQTIEVPLGLTPTEAKRLAEIQVVDPLASIIRFGPVGLPSKYSRLEPTDVVLLTGRDGSTYRARILKRTDKAGYATIEGVLDDATAVLSTAVTSGGYNSSSLVRSAPPTTAYLLDIPILRDVDNTPGFYAVFSAPGDNWRGARLSKSPDDINYTPVIDTITRGLVGAAQTALGDWTGGNMTDEHNVVQVNVGATITLSSYTDDDLVTEAAQGYLLGDELIYARTATLVDTGIYDLSGLLRGRLGSEWATGTHEIGERFVVLSPAQLRRVQDDQAEIGIPYYWRAVTYGQSLDAATSQQFTDTGVGMTPYAPVDFEIARNVSGDAALSWHRRSRLSSRFLAAGVDPPIGEIAEGYVVEIWDSSYTTLKRTIIVAGPPGVTYTAAQQTADFGSTQTTIYARVYQTSASVGRGYKLQAAA